MTDRDTLMERTRAARALVNSARPHEEEDLELEAFMGLFFPDKQKNRAYMMELKEARRAPK